MLMLNILRRSTWTPMAEAFRCIPISCLVKAILKCALEASWSILIFHLIKMDTPRCTILKNHLEKSIRVDLTLHSFMIWSCIIGSKQIGRMGWMWHMDYYNPQQLQRKRFLTRFVEPQLLLLHVRCVNLIGGWMSFEKRRGGDDPNQFIPIDVDQENQLFKILDARDWECRTQNTSRWVRGWPQTVPNTE